VNEGRHRVSVPTKHRLEGRVHILTRVRRELVHRELQRLRRNIFFELREHRSQILFGGTIEPRRDAHRRFAAPTTGSGASAIAVDSFDVPAGTRCASIGASALAELVTDAAGASTFIPSPYTSRAAGDVR